MTKKSYVAVVISLLLGTSTSAFAEWPSTPTLEPIRVAQDANSPLIAPDNEGGAFVSFRNGGFYDDKGGFDVLIQHYDSLGNPSWNEPLLVFDTSKSWASYYGTVTDSEGNAYIASDIFAGSNYSDHSAVHLAKITKDGKLAWEQALNLTPNIDLPVNGLGISLGAHADNIVAAWIKSTSGYTVDSFGSLTCVNKEGKLVWSKDITINNSYTFATQPIVNDDSVIVLLEVGATPETTDSHFMVQKYSIVDGKPMWAEPINITSGDNFVHRENSGRAVEVKSDGEGGVVLGFYHITGPNQGIILLQHVRADGQKVFPGQGLRLSGDSLENGAVSLAYDGETYYVTWSASQSIQSESGESRHYSAIKGVAINQQGKFIWNSDGSTHPSMLKDWKQLNTEGPLDNWFSGYTNPAITLNEHGHLNMTYGEETIYKYYLYAQVIDAKTGDNRNLPVSFSDGPIEVIDNMAFGRTIFGQPILSYVVDSGTDSSGGTINLLNFDGNANSGVSKDILVEKIAPIHLSPGEDKLITLKVLDPESQHHEKTVSSATGVVHSKMQEEANKFAFTISTDNWLEESDTVLAKAQDLGNVERIGLSEIKVKAPSYRPPKVMPFESISVNEQESALISANIDAAADAKLEFNWQQTAGPSVNFTANNSQLNITTDYVAADTTLTFALSVTDGVLVSEAMVDVIVKNTSTPTIKGADAEAQLGQQFTLQPTIEAAKLPISYHWSQVSGARTVYTVGTEGSLNGTAPLSHGAVTFLLEAKDANGEMFSKSFNLNVAEPSSVNSSGGSLGFSLLLLGLFGIWKRVSSKFQFNARGSHV